MHGIGGIARADDNLAGLDFEALAAAYQLIGVVLVAEHLGEPVAQAGLFLPRLMLRDDLVLAPFQRMVEIGRDDDVVGDEPRDTERLPGGGEMDQHQMRAPRSSRACLIWAKLYVAENRCR